MIEKKPLGNETFYKTEKGVARDIISEAGTGKYDLVVLGKQGVSGVRDFLLGSITQKVQGGQTHFRLNPLNT